MKYWPIIIALILSWALLGMSGEVSGIVNGFPNLIDYLKGSWPPDFSIVPSLKEPLIETIQMGLLGISFGSILAIPLSFLSAKETSPNKITYLVSKIIINVCRSIPTLLWAILFVTMVGLGPMAGIFALTTHCIGSLGKYFSEGIETIYPRIKEILEAMQVDGANKNQAILYGLLPAVAPLFASYIIYYLEWSIRVGTILGLVGAGGLGLELTMSIRMFRRQETAAIVLTILFMVMVIDGVSRIARKNLTESTV